MRPLLFFMLAGLFLLGGCDQVTEPYPPGSDPTTPVDTSGPATRRVLLEDFNGHRCNNCPAATALALDLVEHYGHENLIMVGLHVINSFAAPYPPIGDGEYDTDFRTAAGTAYAQSFGVMFLPAGMVNRKAFNESQILDANVWGSATEAIIGQPAAMDVQVSALGYTPGNDQITATVTIKTQEALSGEHRLVVYLTEDPVIDWQLDSGSTPPDIPEYPHRHVLRGTVTDIWGEVVIDTPVNEGTFIERDLTYTLPDNVVDPSKCALVAYVYEMATDEVLQVTERKFVP